MVARLLLSWSTTSGIQFCNIVANTALSLVKIRYVCHILRKSSSAVLSSGFQMRNAERLSGLIIRRETVQDFRWRRSTYVQGPCTLTKIRSFLAVTGTHKGSTATIDVTAL